jgi:hypothetical protein
MNRNQFFTLISLLILVTVLKAAPNKTLLHSKLDWTEFKLQGLQIEKNKNNQSILKLQSRRLEQSLFDLDFESPYGSTILDTKVQYKGKSSAKFNGKGNAIEIPHGKLDIFHNPTIKEPFYISFFLNPTTQEGESNLITKSIFRSGLEHGFQLNLVKGQLELRLNRFLTTEASLPISAKIRSTHKLPARKWSHIILEFSPANLTTTLYFNGMETAKLDANLIRSQRVTSFSFHPDDSTPLFFCKEFYGNFDELTIGKGSSDPEKIVSSYPAVETNLDSKMVHQDKGIAISPVYKTEFSFSSLLNYKLNSIKPLDSIMEVWFRSSLQPFSAYDSEFQNNLTWKRLTGNETERICNLEDNKSIDNICFTYYQWKFILRANPQGNQSPSITDFSYNIHQSIPPKPVSGLKWDEFESNLEEPQICMTWIANDESNVWNGGGYILYYGFKENEVAGTIFYHSPLNPKKESSNPELEVETVEKKPSTRVSLMKSCLDNPTIAKNSEKFEPEKNLPFLRPGTTVYIWISAVNSFWSESGAGRDQISPKSKPISITLPSKGQ